MTTELKFAHIGMGNIVCANKIIAMIRPKTKCGARYLRGSKKAGMYIDACLARPIKTLILMDDGHVIGSAITAKTLMKRCNAVEKGNIREEDVEDANCDVNDTEEIAPEEDEAFDEAFNEDADGDEEDADDEEGEQDEDY